MQGIAFPALPNQTFQPMPALVMAHAEHAPRQARAWLN